VAERLSSLSVNRLYDDTANLRAEPFVVPGTPDTVSATVYGYDAWNRLVLVEKGATESMGVTPRASSHPAATRTHPAPRERIGRRAPD